MMSQEEIRGLEIKISKALGFTVERGTLYAPPPKKTLLGGDYRIHVGSKLETPEVIAQVWRDYTPRFARSMDEAMWLLDFIYERDFIDYNLFRDNDERHTCEIGYWADESGRSDKLWQATDESAALAVALAVSKCPYVMDVKSIEL